MLFVSSITCWLSAAYSSISRLIRSPSVCSYLAHKGEVREPSGKLWEQIIAQDFAAFRKEGLTRPIMADIEKELGISR